MNRNVLMALGCVGIIIIAFLLLSYGRKYEVASILMFGYVLDAVATAGIGGNMVVFALTKTTKLNPFRVALWTFAGVHASLLLFLLIVVSKNDPRFNMPATVIGYLVSFVIWTAIHYAWRHRPPVYS